MHDTTFLTNLKEAKCQEIGNGTEAKEMEMLV